MMIWVVSRHIEYYLFQDVYSYGVGATAKYSSIYEFFITRNVVEFKVRKEF
jgi:hypothetical protein